MTNECLQLMEQLGKPLDAALSAHLAACPRCRAVADAHEKLSRARATEALDGDSFPSVQSLAQAASRPARPWWIDGLVAAGLNVLVSAAGVWMLRGEVTVANLASPAKLWTIGALLAVLAIAGPTLALAPGRRPLRTWLLASLPLLALAVVLGGSGFLPAQGWMRAGIPCFLMEISLSLAPAIFIVWALTGFAFGIHRAAIAGSSAGAVGALALHLHCRIGTAPHLLGFHVLPWVALVAAAVAVRSRLASRSFAP